MPQDGPSTPLRRFEGRVLIVTGATGGLGHACVLRLVEEGAAVVAVGRRSAACAALVAEVGARGGSVVAVVADVTDRSAPQRMVDAALASFGRLDGAVNSAGMSPPAQGVIGYSDDLWDETFDVNVHAVFRCMRAQLEHLVPTGRGAIVNVASYTARTVQSGGVIAYAASKHAVLGMTRAAARDCAASGVRVNAVGPGHIRTRMIDRLLEAPGGPERLRERIPMQRVSEPSEIAATVAFMLSDDASFVTGQMLVADGGLSI
ncbi:SDR family oxidoreductase [Jatrophihabitans sp.]|uniref:SDR family NAD(P)-dependent oxidoreductase n=1 Tax=Jatrophihabitans sp. TaxID=1932789 RepID=UPI0030C74870|nr:Short-chain dehydrogenase/reductase [Jatrophihabitans sp.]